MRLFSIPTLILVACGTPTTDDGVTTDPTDVPDVEGPRRVAEVPQVVDVGLEAGIQAGGQPNFQRGRACVVADFDLDGRTDLYVGNPGDTSVLLRNESGDGEGLRFAEGGGLVREDLAWAASTADIDNDGDQDLYVSNGANEGRQFDRLFRNLITETGEARFEDITAEAGIAGPFDPSLGHIVATSSANGAWGDVDNDGDLDLFVSTNVNTWTTYEGSIIGRNVLWINDGTGHFTDGTDAFGLSATRLPTRHSVLLDLDNDGDLDLYENNFKRRNVLWRNTLMETGRTGFVDATDDIAALGADVGAADRTFAAAAGDFNNDGWEDLIAFTRGVGGGDCGGESEPEDELTEIEGHYLYLNLGPERGFVEVADLAGLNVGLYQRSDTPMGGLGVMGCQVADLNADGLLDVFIGNGGPFGGEHNELYTAVEIQQLPIAGKGKVAVPVFADWSDLIDVPAPEPAESELRYPPFPYRTHGTCVADLDDDGMPEMLITNGGPAFFPDAVREPNRLFQFRFTDQGRPDTLHVRLWGDGDHVPLDPMGARVTVRLTDESGTPRTLYRRLYGGSAFSGQNGFDLFFGLGFATSIDELTIDWPHGVTQTVSELPEPNGRLDVTYLP